MIRYLKKRIIMSALLLSIDSVLKIEKRTYLQVYLEQCKYKLKKRKPVNFINTEVGLSDSENDS